MMSLSDIMEFDDNVISIDDERVLLIDGHNIAYITVYSTIGSDYSDNGVFKLWKHSFLSKLFATIDELKPTKVVLAFDSKNSWRYKIYPEYKAHRKNQSGRYPLDKVNFIKALEELICEIKEYFPCICVIKCDETEGDDIIAVMSKEIFNKENYEVIIVSGDTDLNQLLSLKNVKQYNPLKNEYYNVINPKKTLQVKILSGDKSDNIPPIKRLVGVKTAEKILNMSDGIDSFIESQPTDLEKRLIHESYERNIKLIDLDFIPQNIKSLILETYNDTPIIPIDGKKVGNYLLKNKLNGIRSKWNTISINLKKLA